MFTLAKSILCTLLYMNVQCKKLSKMCDKYKIALSQNEHTHTYLRNIIGKTCKPFCFSTLCKIDLFGRRKKTTARYW